MIACQMGGLIGLIGLTFSTYAVEQGKFSDIAQVVIDVEQDESTIPGVVAAIANDTEVLWLGSSNCLSEYESSGFTCPQSMVSVVDQFRIGSETKTFTGTVILQMIDSGDLSLSDTLDTLAPELEIPGGDSITLRDLLRMTSGIPDYLTAPALAGSGTINDQYVRAFGNLSVDPDVYVKATNSMERTLGMSYSNTNFAILALIAEKKSCDIFESCQSLSQLLSHYIFEPLNLTETRLPDTSLFTRQHASGYVMIKAGEPITGEESLISSEADELIDDFTFITPGLPWAAGAIISTLEEQIRWVRQLVKNDAGLLSADLQQQRLTDTVAGSVAGAPANYGLAVYDFESPYNGSTFTGHSGAIFGFTSSLFHNSESDLFYVVNVNQFPANQSAVNFLWEIDRAARYVELQGGNCQGEDNPPETCSGLSVRTTSLMIPQQGELTVEPSRINFNGYDISKCNTPAETGATTCSPKSYIAPTLAFYGHDLDGVVLQSARFTLDSDAQLYSLGRGSCAIQTSGNTHLNIQGEIVVEGSGSQAICGGGGDDTLLLGVDSSVTGNIDLGAGSNRISLESASSLSGHIILSQPYLELTHFGNTLSLSLISAQEYEVLVTGLDGARRTYSQADGVTVALGNNEGEISSDEILVPIDLDENGENDIVIYTDEALGQLVVALSTSLFQTNFEVKGERKRAGSGISSTESLLLMLSLILWRGRRKMAKKKC